MEPEKQKTVVQQHQKNFETLRRAFANGDVALLECQLKSSGELVAVIVAAEETGGDYQFIPFAMFFNGSPYDLLNPPNPGGGFNTGDVLDVDGMSNAEVPQA